MLSRFAARFAARLIIDGHFIPGSTTESFTDFFNHNKKYGNDDDQQRCHRHTTHNRCPDRSARVSTRAKRDRQRNRTEDKGKGCHQDGS